MPEALEYGQLALDLHDRTHDEAGRSDALATLAETERRLGRYTEAVRHSTEAVEVAAQIDDAERRCRAFVVVAQVHASLADPTAAMKACSDAYALLDSLPAPMARIFREQVTRIQSSLQNEDLAA